LLGCGTEDSALNADESLLFDELRPVTTVGFELESACQGEEGLRFVQERFASGLPYALAFVDVLMPPGWDGIETIGRLWQVDPNLQIVICTAYSDYSWSDIRTKLGSSDNLLILKKPFDNIEVIQLAHALTRKWLVSRQAHIKLEGLDAVVALRTQELRRANEALTQEFSDRLSSTLMHPFVGVLTCSSRPPGKRIWNSPLRLNRMCRIVWWAIPRGFARS
jgi:DNA-binding LytR/AlgR family response regulator